MLWCNTLLILASIQLIFSLIKWLKTLDTLEEHDKCRNNGEINRAKNIKIVTYARKYEFFEKWCHCSLFWNWINKKINSFNLVFIWK